MWITSFWHEACNYEEATKIRLYEKNNPCQPAYAIGILCIGVYDCIVLSEAVSSNSNA